jgi:GMP synthase-like glutamine amidotransferase
VASPGLILQHDDDAPAALLGEWLDEHAIPYRVHAAGRDPAPDDPRAYPFVVTLGAEESATDDHVDWVVAELDFLRRAIDADVPVLGLCFGGQILARALGGSVARAAQPEIGWTEVETDAPDLVPPGPWLEFHFDAFEVPPGARDLARNDAGPQAFALGRHLGVQFHPEVTPEIVDRWAADVSARRPDLGIDREALRGAARRHGADAARRAARLFDAWFARAVG